ncbi:MAG: DUF5069 domain-containing protein [Verrucomicrobiales bacterium]
MHLTRTGTFCVEFLAGKVLLGGRAALGAHPLVSLAAGAMPCGTLNAVDKPRRSRKAWIMATAPDSSTVPCSPLDEVCGLAYFPRLTGKIRLHAAGRLWEELHSNLGRGLDAWCVDFLHVSYEDLRARVLEGGSDGEIFEWCTTNGRALNDSDLLVWRHFTAKFGWNDKAADILTKRKAENGLSDRDDIQTMAHYIDIDEGRKV